MLTGGTDQLYRDVLAAGHRRYIRVEVWSGSGVLLDSLIPQQFTGDPEGGLALYSGSSMEATLTSRVSRQLNLFVPAEMYPDKESDLLAPFGNEIRVFAGVTLGDGSDKYVWQIFRGKIRTVGNDGTGMCSIQCGDRANDVLDVAFASPENSQAGDGIVAEFQRLILGALDDASFGDSDVFHKPVEPMTWEFDRGSALDELAKSVGALWYPLANGDFVIRRIPWTVQADPVITLTDEQGGNVNAFTRARSRENIFNQVTVTGERLNGDAPVFATSSDTNPLSPTYIGGSFGVKSIVERLQTPGTQGGAQSTADTLLRSYVTPIEEWSLGTTADAALELGDVIRVRVDGRDVIQVVSNFTFPLDLSGNMAINTRSLAIGLAVQDA